ncbi:MAG: prepilin-type N-terminal cleavage/methylation domain-containing protein [Armatimonadetes bacterium]|nr:prepilin-type N-terminal cleavage/methylation domain-containing protein [Armatimonadota bacterium]
MASNRHCNHFRAFTLIELLVVIAIIAILAAILFPVFAQAKAAAWKTKDLSNFKQVATASAMYVSDYDGAFMMSNRGGLCSQVIGWGFQPPDAVPGVVLYPYTKNTEIHACPVDPHRSEEYRINEHIKEVGWAKPINADQRLYALMVRSNIGYNYAFFSPWRYYGNPRLCTSGTVTESEVTNPSATMMFGDSIWYRDVPSGNISGGGNWVVETPCWEDENNVPLRPINKYAPGVGDDSLFSYPNGWKVATASVNSDSWLVYGGLWPMHNQKSLSNIQPGLKDGQLIIINADTSAKSVPINRLTQGCTAYGTRQNKGNRTDPEKFIWDLD